MAMKLGCCIALFFLLASVAVIIAISVIQGCNWTHETPGLKYGIVVDSGSSRSTVYLYQWPAEKENNTGVVTENMHCQVAGPGISDMNVDPARDVASWKAIRACMANVTKAIPPEQHSATPVFLGATAGMRLLHAQNEEASNTILQNLRDYLKSLPFSFHNASIISGQEEGLYGWITVNYLMGNFLDKNLWNAWARPHGAETRGSMDLGGASTQIAFAVPEDLTGQDYLPVTLYGYDYNIYTHSFLCYGKNEAEKRVQAALVKSSKDPTTVVHPCLPRGFNHTIPASSIFNSECTEAPEGYDPALSITMVGAADRDACGDVVRSLFNLSCTGNCSFNGVEQPPLSGGFMAYAGFYYSAAALYLSGTSTLDTFNSTMQDFCAMDWPTLKKERTWIRDKFLKSYCFSTIYVYTLLVDGYKFNEESWKTIQFQKEVKNTSIAWSLGYMLTLSNMIPAEAKLVRLPLNTPLFGGLLFLFSALTIVSVMFLLIKLRNKKR
ncbi:ectonucleoside triphosphate diphosphohydrolase 3 [Osmerus mordax]|uniref:ectonucleoside triphosphate diphosphohydrolase 3 n=1 Tax=Osmerus mordax TaxID=8014 RepID=UPI00350ED499